MRKIFAFICICYALISLFNWTEYGEISVTHPIIVIGLSAIILLGDEKNISEDYCGYDYDIYHPHYSRNWVGFNKKLDKELTKKALKKYNKNNKINVNG